MENKWEENIEYWKEYRENSMLSFNNWMGYADRIQRPLIITDECKERFLLKSPVIWLVQDVSVYKTGEKYKP